MVRADSLAQGPIDVEVAYSPQARQVEVVVLRLAAGSTVEDAIRASGLAVRFGLLPGALACGVWGRRAEPGTRLRDADRVELYRALTVDPKEARRQRYKGQRKRKEKRPAVAGR